MNQGDEIVSAFMDGTDPQTISPAGLRCQEPAWSPDGKRVLFACGPIADVDLYVADADGANAAILFSPSAYGGYVWDLRHPSWSVNGVIAVQMDDSGGPSNVFTIAEDGTGLDWVAYPNATGSRPAWSPDGSALAVVVGASLWVLHSPTDQVAVSDPFSDIDAAWTPDGKALVYGRYDLALDPVFGLSRVSPDGTGTSLIAKTSGQASCPSVARDGQTIAYEMATDEPPWSSVFVRKGSGAAIELVPGGRCPRCQP